MIKHSIIVGVFLWIGCISTLASAAGFPMPSGVASSQVYMDKMLAKPQPPEYSKRSTFKRLNNAQQATKIREQAKQYEIVFVAKMLEQAVPKGEEGMLFGGGHGNDIYRSMMIEQYAEAMVDDGGLGLTDQLAKEILNRR